MFGDVIAAGTKALGGARFSLVSILPGTLFAAIVLLAALSGAYGPGDADLRGITTAAEEWGAGGAILLVFGLFLTGVLLQPFQVALVQYLEGYWDRAPIRLLSTLAVERHRRRMRAAQVEMSTEAPAPSESTFRAVADSARAYSQAARHQQRAESVFLQYPRRMSRVMPTMLGNILRNGEDAAGERYGLDALALYPRMYPSISAPMLGAMARQLDLIALTASLTVAGLAAAAATSPLLVVRRDLWALLPVAAVLLSVISYRGALRAARDHGVLLATTFDLHRFDMIRALHHTLPDDFAAEKSLNLQLTRFFQQRRPPLPELAARRYDHSIYDTTPATAASPVSLDGADPPAGDGPEPTPPP